MSESAAHIRYVLGRTEGGVWWIWRHCQLENIERLKMRSRCHVYTKPRTPQLNGKVERSHRSDKEEFYQLLTYTDDVDLNKKLTEWERFYNFDRPHGAFEGRTPYEALRALMK